jgi:hypothetical protein
MKEDFLHYVWKFQKFDAKGLKTTSGQTVRVKLIGQHNFDSGPDFFNSQLYIGSQLWAGNVEIHIKASDWFAHGHELDKAYDNVILHVVWENDSEIYRKDGTTVPTIVVKDIIFSETLSNYQKLFSKKHKWINCENEFRNTDDFLLKSMFDRLYIERLERKSHLIAVELKKNNNNWEALLFQLLSKNFGLKVNGDAFLGIAQSVDFSVVQKCSQKQFDLESLLLGQARFLDTEKEDGYLIMLQKNYVYIKHKFKLENSNLIAPKFFRLRPPNFPTIRLSQLTALYTKRRQLFSEVIFNTSGNSYSKGLSYFYELFDVAASEYWDTHYNFGVISVKRRKALSKNFIDLLLINTIIPLQFYFAKQMGGDASEALLELASGITSEENTVVKKYLELRPMKITAFESQALMELKTMYCDKMKCLDCRIGNSIINKSAF